MYQLRKLMLEAFKMESNRKFFRFYYDNFKPVADFLVQENKLDDIVPGMLKCVELSKKGKYNLAFEEYITTCKQVYQICKDLGMNISLEDKWKNLYKTIYQLPEPNNLFVENSFTEAIKSC